METAITGILEIAEIEGLKNGALGVDSNSLNPIEISISHINNR